MRRTARVAPATGPLKEVPVDWEALEDAFENNAPEVHSYLHLTTGEVLRVVDGVADPQMHVRIASDGNYLRIDPVSSREQYRWMERFIPMVDEGELRTKLTQAIDGKGAFRRFKDVLMSFAPEREQWFTFRSERLRTFMEAWLARPRHPGHRPPHLVRSPACTRERSRARLHRRAAQVRARQARPQRRVAARQPQGAGRAARPARPRDDRRPSPSSSRRAEQPAASRTTTSTCWPSARPAPRPLPPRSSTTKSSGHARGVAHRPARARHRARRLGTDRAAWRVCARDRPRPRRRPLLRPGDGRRRPPALRPRAFPRLRGPPRGHGRQPPGDRRRLPGAEHPQRARARRRRAVARHPRTEAHRRLAGRQASPAVRDRSRSPSRSPAPRSSGWEGEPASTPPRPPSSSPRPRSTPSWLAGASPRGTSIAPSLRC